MRVENYIILFLSVWAVSSALLSPSVELFVIFLLIGSLICLEIADFYINKRSKEILKSIIYILIIIFVFILIKKVYEILVK
ncbi:MAG: hypothetical protein GXN95_04530 [Methanococci archaeon]|nr:hypothetical protein [Methanococci archaeon]